MRILAIDIGASSIKAGIISETNGIFRNVESVEKISLDTNEFSELRQKVLALCSKKMLEGVSPLIGISTAGSVDNNGKVISAGNFNNYCNIIWQDILRKELRNNKIIAYTVNDGRASAWGEYMVFEPRAKTHVHVVVGTGIGGGVIHNGDLLQGDSGQAGYIGHIKITSEETPVCSCGKMGCVESLASARGIVGVYNKMWNTNCDTFEQIMASAKDAPDCVRKTLERSGYWLGIALGNVMNVLNPQRVTIGGGVILATIKFSEEFQLVENPYYVGVKKGIHYAAHRRVEASGLVELGILGNDAGIVGAANLVAKLSFDLLPE